MMGGRGHCGRWGLGIAIAMVLTSCAADHGGAKSPAYAFQRIVSLAPPPAVRHAPSRPWARLPGLGGSRVSCRGGALRRLRVIIPGGRSRRCATVRIAGGRCVTWLAISHGSFWAQPLYASRGVVVRALGAHGQFRRVILAVHDGRLVVAANIIAPAAQAYYRLEILGRQAVRMAVIEKVWYRNAAAARRDRPALEGFYDTGVGNPMPASAIDPARHDADGLWLSTPRGHSWVPLRNPRRPWSEIYGPGVRAFGLLQRDRAVRYYGVHAAREQDAPDVLVVGPGRGGRVRLRERPTAGHGAPNVWVMFGPQAVDRKTLHYRLVWTRTPSRTGDRAQVISTLIGGNARTGARKYVIDYAKGPVAHRLPDRVVAGRVQVRPDTFVTQDTVGYNVYTHGYRQVLQVMPVPGQSVHVRAWLTVYGRRVSEIWRYKLFALRIAH